MRACADSGRSAAAPRPGSRAPKSLSTSRRIGDPRTRGQLHADVAAERGADPVDLAHAEPRDERRPSRQGRAACRSLRRARRDSLRPRPGRSGATTRTPRSTSRCGEEVEVAAVARQPVDADDRAPRVARAPFGVADAREAVRPEHRELVEARRRSSPCDRAARQVRCAFAQPVDDALAEHALRLAADEHADVAAGQADLAVVLGADQRAQRPRRLRRDDVIVLGVDVEHRHRDLGADRPCGRRARTRSCTSLLSWYRSFSHCLAASPGMMRAVGEPLLHAQEVEQLLLVVDDVEHAEVVLGQRRASGVIVENTKLMSSPGRLPLASIRRSMSSGVRLRVHRLMKPWSCAPFRLVGVEVDRRDREDQVLARAPDAAPHSTTVNTPPSQMPSRLIRSTPCASQMSSTHSSR